MKGTEKKRRLVLLDAHAILHRGYHALPEFTSGTGEPTGALYGLASMLLKIVKDLKPDYVVAAYDLPGPTHRHEAYGEYKATRKKPDDALVVQIKRSRDIFDAFNVPVYEKEGFEADDVLGTIVKQTEKDKDLEVIIASGDNDTLQLVDDKRVKVYTLRKGMGDTVLYDKKAVQGRYGFGPELLPDFKGLSGDPSDNITGIAGIGEKTATSLVTKFGSVEDIYKKLKRDRKKFEEAGIKERAIKLLEEGEEEAKFSKMLAEIRQDVPIKFSIPEKRWRDTLDVGRVVDLFNSLSFRSITQRVKSMFSMGDETERSGSSEGKEPNEGEIKEVALALWLLNSDTVNPSKGDILEFARTRSFEKAKDYIIGELKKQKLDSVYEKIEKPLIPVVQKMETRGIKIDTAYLKKLSQEYHKELDVIEKKIYKYADTEFNINSPKQLADILFDTLGLRAKRTLRTSTGQRSTRESELKKLQGEHPIIDEILKFREIQKLLSTYIDNIPEMVSKDGRLHADFLQAGTTTGRMASQNPNLQNIPIRTDIGKKVRDAFVAEKGYELVSFDYSQIELRVAAFLSGDKELIKTFKEGEDVHTKVASEVFNVDEKDVSVTQRRKAKIINFGIQYGMGVNSLAKAIESDRAQAQKFLDEYMKTFSGLANYMRKVKQEAGEKGYTETYFGRRRLLPGLNSRLPYIRAEAERMAINAPIQGTQADILKIAMAKIDKLIRDEKLEENVFLVLQIHDELIYEAKEEKVGKIVPEIKKIMESVLSPKDTKGVPLVADVSVGKNWGKMRRLTH